MIDVKKAVSEAKKEIAEENLKRAVVKLKELYRKRELAQVALHNIDREIEDAEARIGEGNNV